MTGGAKKMKVISAEEAARLIPSGATVTVSGLLGNMVPEAVLEAIEHRFLVEGQPRAITEIHPWLYGWEDHTGLNHWAHEGLLRRIIGSTFILPTCSKTAPINRFILDGYCEAYCWPANGIFQMLRAVGARRKGFATTVGIDTFADPRRGGGKLNFRTTEDLIRLIEIDGEEHLWYPSIPIDVALIRATSADVQGNLSCEREGLRQAICVQATAAKNSGGIVIAEVRRLVEPGTVHPLMVEVPGHLVDYVVVNEQAKQWLYGQNAGDAEATTGEVRMPLPPLAYPPLDAEKVAARRALCEIGGPGRVINVGAGIPTTLMPITALEEGVYDDIVWSVEHGVFGGFCLAATHWNPTAITSPAWLLDYYHGGGLDAAFLSLAQVDRFGNVNVGRLGDQLPGPGGFTDIAGSTRKVVFVGTFSGNNMDVAVGDGRLEVRCEGKASRFVPDVEMVCFSGRRALQLGQEALYITERAVFRLRSEGLVLEEVAPGVDVRRDILERIPFPVKVSLDLRPMDERLFREEPLFLGLEWQEQRRLSIAR